MQANLSLAEANYERLQPLANSSAISPQELDEARFAVDALKAQLNRSAEQLSVLQEGTRVEQLAAQKSVVDSLAAQIDQIKVLLEEQGVRAPYSGQIQTRNVDEGDVVSPGQLMLTVVESTRLEIEVGLPAEIVELIQSDQAEVFFASESRGLGWSSSPGHEDPKFNPSNSDPLVPAELLRVAPGLERQTRTRKCQFEFESSGRRSIGESVQVVVVQRRGATSDGYWIPTAALSSGPRGLWVVFVPVPEGDSFAIQSRPVELIKTQNSYSKIRGPLDPTEQIVVSGTHRVVPGQYVQILNDSSR